MTRPTTVKLLHGSAGVQDESSVLGGPHVTVRTTTERPIRGTEDEPLGRPTRPRRNPLRDTSGGSAMHLSACTVLMHTRTDPSVES